MHLIWDWNGTLLDDLALVVAATNASLAGVGGPRVTAEEHRRDYRRPIAAYYEYVLGRPLVDGEFAILDGAFHDAYRAGLATADLTADALEAIARVAATAGVGWEELDVDADPALLEEYWDRVPVILLDGKEHGYWRVEEERLLRDLGRPSMEQAP